MINILKSGKDKVFAEKCPYCGTDFTYQSEDVATLIGERPTVECPLCERDVPALLRTITEDGV